MKLYKGIVLTFVFFTLAVSVQGQVTFGSWGRAVVTPLALTGNYSAVSAATSTWGDVPRIGFSANGTAPSGNIGFNLDFDFGWNINSNNVAIIGDNAKAWVKPLALILPERYDMLKLTAGFFKEDEFRGKIGATEFGSWLLPSGSKDEDNIFRRFDATAGAHLRITPLTWIDSSWNGLNIQAAFGSNAISAPGNSLRAIRNLFNNEANDTLTDQYDELHATWDGNRDTSALNVFKAGQYAIGYRIPDVGLARFQFIGGNRQVNRWVDRSGGSAVQDSPMQLVVGVNNGQENAIINTDVYEGAFLYDGLEGLRVDLGFKASAAFSVKDFDFDVYPAVYNRDENKTYDAIPSNKLEYTIQLPYVLALGASWRPGFLPELGLSGRVDLSFGGVRENSDLGIKIEYGYVINAWLIPTYAFSSNFTAGLDLGVEVHGEDTISETGKTPDPGQTAPSKYVDFGFAPWVDIGVGGGKVRIGVVVMLPGRDVYNYNAGSATYRNSPRFKKGVPVISTPISFTYSF
jgi:hypothetical protein